MTARVHGWVAEPGLQSDTGAEKIVHHRKHRAIVARDDAAGEDHRIAFGQRQARVLPGGQPLQGGIAFGLRATREHQQPLARHARRLIRRNRQIARPGEAANLPGNGALSLQATPEQAQLATGALRNLAEQDQALDVTGEHRDHDPRRGVPHQLFERRAHSALGASAHGHVDVGAVAEQ